MGFHLQVLSGGAVRGVHRPDPSCWLKVFSLRQGVVGIQGEKSKLYLCMNGTGQVYAAERFTDECHLKENLQENHYNTYSSERFPGLYLGLSHRGEVKRGTRVGPNMPCAHFLPRRTF
ncbi:fibroblast growth factor 6 [Eucyclogobius newberryi]|uniref:fibroblast growth factor 6 n=1 Tax=Eucyclogobius newberryi TaxID=166745 RepID=UPI003B5C5D0D